MSERSEKDVLPVALFKWEIAVLKLFSVFPLAFVCFLKCKVHIRGPESRHKIEINKLGVEIENLTGHVHHICQYLVNIYHNFLQNTIVIVKISIPKVKIVVLKTHILYVPQSVYLLEGSETLYGRIPFECVSFSSG